MDNEKGLTLVELLIAITLLGIVLISVITIVTGSLNRTVQHEHESRIQFIAQEMTEKILEDPTLLPENPNNKTYCWGNPNTYCDSFGGNSSDLYSLLPLNNGSLKGQFVL